METVKLELSRAEIVALKKLLGDELNSDHWGYAYDNIDLRDLDEVEHVYSLSRVYKAVCELLED